jgi:hypothetical protein
MAIQKNFTITNGLEVNTNLIFADTNSNKVGIATTNANYTLDVRGGIGATGIYVDGDINLGGKIGINSFYGLNGSYLVSTGTGVSWTSLPGLRSTQTYTAIASQTIFNFSYNPSAGVDVYINGVRLSPAEYTATNGTSVILNDGCFAGDTVDLIAYSVAGLGAGNTGITGLTITDKGAIIGNAGNVVSINFVGAAVTSSTTGFGVTVAINDYWNSTNAGIHTLSNVGIGTTNPTSKLTVSGDVSVSGIVTATQGFISVGNTTPIQISLIGNQLTFTAVGIGSTTLTLS